jgi:DNA-binding NarL/FixJ family response regulator
MDLLDYLEGAEVVGHAEGPEEALRALQQTAPDVVLLDFRLVGGDGLAVLKEAKQRVPPAPVVIVLTNHTQLPYRRRCLEAGADYFFDKAKEFDQALRVLEQLIGALPV